MPEPPRQPPGRGAGPLISICIPTFNRPGLLVEAVRSCFEQAYRPLEIVIGDDSRDDRTAATVPALEPPPGVVVRYSRNARSLGQAGNVNAIFASAAGSRLVLLHDDDLLVPGALDALVQAWDAHADVAAVYGKRQFISQAGAPLDEETRASNLQQFKTAEHSGPQRSAVLAALRQQFPNNGYLVRADLARSVGFRPPEIVSDYFTDMDFGIRLALAAGPATFVYVDTVVTKYRKHADTVTGRQEERFNVHLMYEALLALDIPEADREACPKLYRTLALGAFRDYARMGNRKRALQIYLSAHYAQRRWSPRGAYHLMTILMPRLYDWRQRLRFPGGGRGGQSASSDVRWSRTGAP